MAASDNSGHQASNILELAQGRVVELFHNAQKETFVTWRPLTGRERHLRIDSPAFRMALTMEVFEKKKRVPSGLAIVDALRLLSAKALFEGETRQTFLRSADIEGNIFYDLGDDRYNAVKVTESGWTLVDDVPCVFLRPKSLRPLPVPQRNGSLNELRELLNLKDDCTWRLTVCWLIAAMRPTGPYPALVLTGEPGAGKSLTALLLSRLIDPHGAGLRNEPRTEQDLAIAAANNRVLAFDNISRLPPWLSDAFCRFTTGGAYASRQLFSDGEEFLLEAQIPLILTGIEDIATRSDSADRSINIEMNRLSGAQRRREDLIKGQFDEKHGLFFGCLLDLLADALRILPTVAIDAVPRLADFAFLGTAVEKAAGWPKGSLIEAFTENQKAAGLTAIENSVVARTVVRFVRSCDQWTGSHRQLMGEIRDFDPAETSRDLLWPKSVERFSGELRRMAPILRAVGVMYVYGKRRSNNVRLLQLTYRPIDVSQPSRSACETSSPEMTE